ncbi:MAG: single-stranded-DNA-specific exonuclease RecJ [Tuberibacillus sp.]
MLHPKSRWFIAQQDEEAVRLLSDQLGVSDLISRLLVNRGLHDVDAARAFLNIETQDFYDPFLMDGMKEAVERIQYAIRMKEKILVFGDYDADGVSATSIMVLGLRRLGADVTFYVPNRFTEGYGPNVPALEEARKRGIGLVITVDTGIAAHEAAEAARLMGLDYIVTDHHESPPELPQAFVTINPKKPGCPYPFKSLCGAGVAFKVIHALTGEVPYDLIDLATIGTVADLMPLLDENRLLVTKGLIYMANTNRPGLRALMDVCQIQPQAITEDDIGFSMGPRINAAGRMEHAAPAIELMLAETMDEALPLALLLDDYNKERKKIVDQIASEAKIMAEHLPDDLNTVLVLAKEHWHEGVVGIACSRVVEAFFRPAIVLSIDPDTGLAKGSARSIEGFNIYEALAQCKDLFIHFGGHDMAAGMTLAQENVPVLAERLNRIAKEILKEEDFIPITHIDQNCELSEMTLSFIESVKKLAPFGVGNPKPRFVLEHVQIGEIKQIGAKKDHLKILFKDQSGTLNGVAFRKGDLFNQIEPDARISAVGELTINEWNGFRRPQIMVEDLKIDSWQLFDWRNFRHLDQYVEELPGDKSLYVYFNKKTLQSFPYPSLTESVYHFDDIEGEWAVNRPYLVLIDLPESESQVEMLFQKIPFPERIYTVFYHEENRFFSRLPERDDFKKAYIYLLRKKQIDVVQGIRELSAHYKWHEKLTAFIFKVFSELEFVKIENGRLTAVEEPKKKPITSSKLFQRLQEQVKMEETLVLSTRHSLKQWFNRYYTLQNEPEEAIAR